MPEPAQRIQAMADREIALAIDAHFTRLAAYHRRLLGLSEPIEGDEGPAGGPS